MRRVLTVLNLYRTRNTTQPSRITIDIHTHGIFLWVLTVFKQQDQALAQQYIQTIKHRNLVIELDN